MTQTLARPELTLPDVEAQWLRAAYERASVILEYGSGGSTALAAEMGGKTVFSVESDANHAARLGVWLEDHCPKADVRLHWADIGPVGEWGKPASTSDFRKFQSYPLSVWDRDDFQQPDVVLIDGRFRAGCLLAVLYRTKAPVSVYFDDYLNRPAYHVVEDFVPVAEHRGRMARFDVKPGTINPQDLGQVIDIFGQSL